MAQGRNGSLHLSRTALSSAPLFPFTGAFQDSIPAGWLGLGGEGISPSGCMRLRLGAPSTKIELGTLKTLGAKTVVVCCSLKALIDCPTVRSSHDCYAY